jgi:hypothetical protein
MSYVLIWENNMLPGGRRGQTGGHSWVGHASMNIGDTFNPQSLGFDDTWTNYVSWIPYTSDDVKEKRVLGYAAKSAGGSNGNFLQDLYYETYWPDHVIHIPDTGDLLAAEAKWKEVWAAKRASYKMATENCSDIVAKVMKAAGFSGSGAGGWWKQHNLVWTPNKVRKFALAAGGQYQTFSQFMSVLIPAGIKLSDFVDPATGTTVQYVRDGLFSTFRTPSGCKFNNDKTYKETEDVIELVSLPEVP